MPRHEKKWFQQLAKPENPMYLIGVSTWGCHCIWQPKEDRLGPGADASELTAQCGQAVGCNAHRSNG